MQKAHELTLRSEDVILLKKKKKKTLLMFCRFYIEIEDLISFIVHIDQ